MKRRIPSCFIGLFAVLFAASLLTVPAVAFAAETASPTSVVATGGSASSPSASASNEQTSETKSGTSLTGGTVVEKPAAKSAPKFSAKVSYKVNNAKKWTKSGKTAGKAGKNVERIRIKVSKKNITGSVAYRTYEKNKGGWTKWSKNGKSAGIKNWGMRGVQMKLTGTLAKRYDIVYRVHVSEDGWLPWVVNGATAGSKGRLGLIDKMQVKLQQKGEATKVKNGTYLITAAKSFSKALSGPKSTASNKQLKVAKLDQSAQAERFVLRGSADGIVTLQSVSSAKFLSAKGDKVVQRAYADADEFRWKAVWSGGWKFKNVATGMYLGMDGKKAVVKKSAARWSLTAVPLLANGNYALVNQAQSNVLAVKKASTKNGASLIAQKEEESGAEAFVFTHLGSGVYQVTNMLSGKAVAVKGGSKKDGAAVRQYKAKGGKAQQWKVALSTKGFFTLKNRASGKVLTIAAGGAAGKLAKSRANANDATQAWMIKAAPYSLTGDYELDASIVKILKKHTTLRSCFRYVVGFRYRSGSKYGKMTFDDETTVSMAKEMIEHHSGNCYRFAALFSWLARGLGYDTAVKAGYVPAAAGGWAPHGWVEVYKDGKTYICDPDLAHEMPGHAWYMTTYSGAPVTYR